MKKTMSEKYPLQYYYGVGGYKDKTLPLYNPAVVRDIDKSDEEKAELAGAMSQLMDLNPGECVDITPSDELPDDNSHKKVWDEVMMAAEKASEEKKEEIRVRKESRERVHSTVTDLIERSRDVENAVSELLR